MENIQLTGTTLPDDISRWDTFSPEEALQDDILNEDELQDDCEAVLTFKGIWIQKCFDRPERVHKYFTVAERYSEYGTFEACVKLLNETVV